MTNQNVNYFAVIPANVRYDRKVCPNAKLLYGEVTALCNKEGYCWATNKYFAELYRVSTRAVTSWIKQLTDNGYLESEIVYKDGTKEIAARYLRLSAAMPRHSSVSPEEHQPKKETIDPMENNFYTPMEADAQPSEPEDFFHTPTEENFYTPMEEKFQYNNTRNNNTSMNILSFKNKSEGKKEKTHNHQSEHAEPDVGNKGAVCPIPDLSCLKLDEQLRTAADQLQSMIHRLWNTEKITVKGKICNQQYIRSQLSRLTGIDIQTVLEKLQRNWNKIKNIPSYLASMLLQAPDETAFWQIKKAGTTEAVPTDCRNNQKPSYDIDEWERLSLLPIRMA